MGTAKFSPQLSMTNASIFTSFTALWWLNHKFQRSQKGHLLIKCYRLRFTTISQDAIKQKSFFVYIIAGCRKFCPKAKFLGLVMNY